MPDLVPVPPQVTVPGHFGEWIQGRMGADGPVALVTLACPALCARAPGRALRVRDHFSAARLEAFADALGLAAPEWPEIDCDMPLGAGAGASTACLVAAARAAGFEGAPERLARACLALEGASDPLMYDAPDRLLWASRRAEVLRVLPSPPEAEIVGGFWGAPEVTDPGDDAFPDIADLVEFWAQAVARDDLAAVAGIATESARRCSVLRGPGDPMSDLARDLGALGIARAHTGSARALIFAPGRVPDGAEAILGEAGLDRVVRFSTGGAG
ncbi:propanediol utilization protein [Roseovarius sp. D22-M7]|uniref:propanediol utilization protein n=1 Tax=Roseovarius sp. D22-M7 TaxID=3127116 RepID=UPI0030104BD3